MQKKAVSKNVRTKEISPKCRREAPDAGTIMTFPEPPPPVPTLSGVISVKPSPTLHKSAKLHD